MAKQKTVNLAWTGSDLGIEATFADGYHSRMSGPADAEGATPMEYLLAGAAGCTAMDVISILQKKRQPLEGIELEISAQQAEHAPNVFTTAKIVYIIKGDVDEKAVQQAIDLSQEKYCSASIMLKRAGMALETEYRIEVE